MNQEKSYCLGFFILGENMRSTITSKKRILIACTALFVVLGLLCFRVGWIQIVKGEEYTKYALEQQTRDVPIEAKRGVIYDTKGEELAVSATCYSVWARPAYIKEGNKDQNKRELTSEQIIDETVASLTEVLDKDAEEIRTLITKDQALVKVDKYLDKATADKVRELGIYGIELAEDVKRYYPMGAFLAHTLGSVTDDNNGLSGLELEYNQYLSGVEGRWIKNADIKGNDLAYGEEKYYQAEDGLGLVLTIDETIQHYAEKSIATVQKNTNADRVMALMMDPKTGDVLAMAQTPEFDPNDSKTPIDKKEAAKLEKMSDKKKMEYWNKMWRNFLICDVYEPGSTFKLLTTSMALEEGVTTPSEKFTCTGYTQVADWTLKCWRYYQPHGTQTLEEAVGNSCNPVFIKLAQRVGSERFYDYLETFGVTNKTGIDFPGEGNSILQDEETSGPVGLATMAYGHGVAVTPIQLITAISSLGNEGKLMQPRLVKALVNEDGDVVKEFESKVVRQTVSKKTAEEMCEIMEFVVAKGGAGTAKVEGYRVGGKTGTANKPKDGGYSDETNSSFIGMAPMDDPKVAVLVIVDNPKGVKYGSTTAAPGAKLILEDTLRYLDLKPKYTEEEKKELSDNQVTVPDLIGEGLDEAIGILGGEGLGYEASGKQDDDFIVQDQYPKAGEKIEKGGTVYLYRK